MHNIVLKLSTSRSHQKKKEMIINGRSKTAKHIIKGTKNYKKTLNIRRVKLIAKCITLYKFRKKG